MKYYKSSSWLKMLHEQFYIIEKDFELQFSDDANTFSVNLAPGIVMCRVVSKNMSQT